MLSVVLYGRNDNHGYNYHKRLAISLNCIAEVLSDPKDEILFVDYNSPDELPTIVQAIQDTLTPKAKALTRIFRVRPSQHQQFREKTSLPLLEPIARNIAIRRSRPDNRWILSTNVDIIFVPEKENESLTQLVSALEDGFYSLPRFELPENFWELTLERSNPEWNISLLRQQYKKLHLNAIIRKEGFLKYENPGDFQLMLRKDVFQIGGFDEEMLNGWHVDSNLCKRMSLLGKVGSSLEGMLSAFHCNHTYKESFLHSKNRTENDWNRFVNQVKNISSQQDWGLSRESIEEISLLTSSKIHLDGVAACLKNSPERTYDFLVHRETFNQLTYTSSRIFIYLADHLCNISKTANIAYIGYNIELLHMIDDYFEKNHFSGKILCLSKFIDTEHPRFVVFSEVEEIVSQTSLFIFDFGFEEKSIFGKTINGSQEGYIFGRSRAKKVMQNFFKVINKKNQIQSNAKFIGINVNHTDFNVIFTKHLSTRLNSYNTGISYGYLPMRNKIKKPFPSKAALKKRVLHSLYYYIVRHLFNHTDWIRSKRKMRKIC